MKKYKSEKLNDLRSLIKIQAELRKYLRLTRKLEHDKSYDVKLNEIRNEIYNNIKLQKLSYIDLRFYYIAYGLLLGRKYEQIENKCKPEKELDNWKWTSINNIIEQYKEVLDEKNVSIGS